jgi:hypothetical protein
LYSQRNEIGASFGYSYYLGDINPANHFRNAKPGFGVLYKRNLTTHFSIRAFYNRLHLQAFDSLSDNAYQRVRNLDFDSKVHEIGGILEFNFFAFEPGNVVDPIWYFPKERATFYSFIGLTYFHNDPHGFNVLDNDWIPLHPTHTEAQDLGEGNRKIYSKYQIAVPFGIGVKYNIFQGVMLSLEWGMRMTFTDYVDDIGGVYPDRDLLAVSGYTGALLMADKSTNTSSATRFRNEGRQRGFIYSKDWYNYTSLILSFRIKDKAKFCYKFKKKMYYRF